MSTHQLDLLENALDSLAEALAKYERANTGTGRELRILSMNIFCFVI